MNNIFYWLWLADALDAISGISLLVVIGYSLFFFFTCCAFIACWDESYPTQYIKRILDTLIPYKKFLVILLCPLVLAFVLIVTLPSKTTIYVSLGASVTADIGQSSTGQKALQLLNNKLDDLLNQEKEEKK